MPELPAHGLMNHTVAQKTVLGLGRQVRDQPDGHIDLARIRTIGGQQDQGRSEFDLRNERSGTCLRIEIAVQAREVEHADEVGEDSPRLGVAQAPDDLRAVRAFPVFENEPLHPGSHSDQIDEAVDRIDALDGLLRRHEDITTVTDRTHRVASALGRAESDDGDRFDSVGDRALPSRN
ncbi:hypothetical protein [Brevibacterium permense]|uniref:Uncharacterized protein n=1 Tax=Brevibacterium permense TaxID=234834 RepID=A0ABP4KZF5_9MICO|nr:hypothetical protein [Brevibacterium permense]